MEPLPGAVLRPSPGIELIGVLLWSKHLQGCAPIRDGFSNRWKPDGRRDTTGALTSRAPILDEDLPTELALAVRVDGQRRAPRVEDFCENFHCVSPVRWMFYSQQVSCPRPMKRRCPGKEQRETSAVPAKKRGRLAVPAKKGHEIDTKACTIVTPTTRIRQMTTPGKSARQPPCTGVRKAKKSRQEHLPACGGASAARENGPVGRPGRYSCAGSSPASGPWRRPATPVPE